MPLQGFKVSDNIVHKRLQITLKFSLISANILEIVSMFLKLSPNVFIVFAAYGISAFSINVNVYSFRGFFDPVQLRLILLQIFLRRCRDTSILLFNYVS